MCGIVRAVIGPGSQHPAADPGTGSGATTTAAVVWLAGLTAVVIQTGARAWAVYPGWFAADDYRLLAEARTRPLTWHLLVGANDLPALPFGRLTGWVVAHHDPFSWSLAAHLSVALQAVAGLACLWMLVTLFGPRPGILVPLVVYLSSAAGLPAFLWWSAAMSELPGHAALFVSVASWVRFLRSRHRRWIGLTVVSLSLAVVSWRAAPLLPLVLLAVTVVHVGGPDRSVRRRAALGWATAVLGTVGVTAGMVAVGRSWLGPGLGQVDGESWRQSAGMLATGIPVTVLGGPERWSATPPPILTDQRSATLAVAAVVLACLAVAISMLVRRRTGRVWVLIAACCAGLAALGPALTPALGGPAADADFLLLAPALPVVTVGLGLVALPAVDARGATQTRVRAARWAGPAAVFAVGLGGLAAVGGAWSSTELVRDWRAADAGHAFVDSLRLSASGLAGPPDLVDTPLPPDVAAPGALPGDSVSGLMDLTRIDARFPEHSDDLRIVDDQGRVRPVLIDTDARARTGPATDCGWLVRQLVTIPLDAETPTGARWLRLGYLAPDESPVRVAAGASVVDARVRKGLHSLWVRADGPFRAVSVSGLDEGVALCIDVVEVGTPVPEESP